MMKNNLLYILKTAVFAGIALFVLAFAWIYVNRYLQRPKADTSNVNFVFTPSSGSFVIGANQTMDVVIQPADSSKKISGINLDIVSDGVVKLVQVKAPLTFPGNANSNMSQLIYNVADQRAVVAYIASGPTDQLPAAVKLQVVFKADSAGSGNIRVETSTSQVTGNIAANTYGINPLSTNSFAFTAADNSTPTVTPPSNNGEYNIDIGDKQSLSIDIGAGTGLLIRFKAKLANLYSFPDMYLRLRVRDELATVNNPSQSPADACNNPPPSDRDFFVPVAGSGGTYSPAAQNSATPPTGATVASVSTDGWVTLAGISPDKYYTLYLKGPKTRKGRMIQHVILRSGQIAEQNFDWTGSPLDPGDLPDPNNGSKQDCVINATDWSLVQTYLGSDKADSNSMLGLSVADVNYDGQVNAGDSVAILDTLNKRPDDDF